MQSRLAARSGAVALTCALALLASCSSSSPQQQPKAAQVVSLAISVAKPQLAKGTQLDLSAKALYDDQSLKDVTELATWSSADPAVLAVEDCRARGLALGSGKVTVAFGGKTASASLTVTAATLVSIAIDPPTVSLAKGRTSPLEVTGTFTDGTTQDMTRDAAWSSAAADVAAVASGLLQARGEGAAVVHATVQGLQADASVTVTAAELKKIAIDQAPFRTIAGLQRQLTTSGLFTDDSADDLSGQVTWASSDDAVCTVSNLAEDRGALHAVAAGRCSVTATAKGFSASIDVTVDAAQLVSVEVQASAAQLPKGLTLRLTAVGSFDNGSTSDLTTQVMWKSSDDEIAMVSAAGLVTAIAVGEATFTATTTCGKSATRSVAVSSAIVSALEIAPATVTLPAGLKKPFTALATFSDQTRADATASVTWDTSDHSIAAISNAAGSKGLLSTLAAGKVDVTAQQPGSDVKATLSIDVSNAALLSLAISPARPASLPKGLTQAFKAEGVYSDDTHHDVTSSVVWTSSNDAVAVISNAAADRGLAAGLAESGESPVVIQAQDPVTMMTATVRLTVSAAAVIQIDLSAEKGSIAKGFSSQFAAMATYSDHSMKALTGVVSWTSSKPGAARINSSGLASTDKASAIGKTEICATLLAPLAVEDITECLDLEVTAAVLQKIGVMPVDPKSVPFFGVPRFLPVPFAATGFFSDQTSQDLTTEVTWSADNGATVSNSDEPGVVRGFQVGSVHVSAAAGDVAGSFKLCVSSAVLDEIAISPSSVVKPNGIDVQFRATGHYVFPGTHFHGGAFDLTKVVTWRTNDWPGASGKVADVSNARGSQGFASTLAVGTTTVLAVEPETGFTGNAILTVTPAILLSLAIGPDEASIAKGLSQRFTVEGTFSDESKEDLTNQVFWFSGDSKVAPVSRSGVAFGAAVGSVTVKACFFFVCSGTASLDVTDAQLLSIVVERVPVAAPDLMVGQTLDLQAIGTYTDGVHPDPMTASVAWDSSAADVAQVSNAPSSVGVVIAIAEGQTTITAIDPVTKIYGSLALDVGPALP